MIHTFRFCLLILFAHTSGISFAQIATSGRILNELNEALPYATINIEGSRCGALTDENGYFELTCPEDSTREKVIVVRYLGYKTKTYNIEELDKHKDIILTPTRINLRQISIVASRKMSKATHMFQYTFNRPRYYYQTNIESTYQLASHIENKDKSIGYLSEIIFRIGQAASGKVPLRINFYTIDPECSCPDSALNATNIIVNAKRGKNRIYLTDYKIFLNGTDFYVALEWLSVAEKGKKKFDFSIGMIPFKSNYQLLEKQGGLKWQKVDRGRQSRIWTKIKLVNYAQLDH